jgi:hypothetical protein
MIPHAYGDCEAGLWRVIDSFSNVKVNDAGGAFSQPNLCIIGRRGMAAWRS